MREGIIPKAFNKKNAYVREAGKEGLYATFANNGVEITLSSNGKASIKTDSSTFSYKTQTIMV